MNKIPKKYRNMPWCVCELKIGDLGEFYFPKKLKVNDEVAIVTNVNLFLETFDVSKEVWRTIKVTEIKSSCYYSGKVVK